MSAETARMNILIADDEPISRKLLEKLLAEKVDAHLIVACDGQQAWQIVQDEVVHMVMADWMMPGMDGVQLCQKIRETSFSRYVYFILVTARDDQADVLEGLNAGADDYIRKPFDPNELQLRVNAGLRLVRLEEELAKKNRQLEELNEKLSEMARIDPLMKIGNRNSFYEAIERLQNQAVRYDRPYGLVMCDIDHFKLYNDTQGHQAGDRVLEAVAQAIKHTIRPSDEAFRYGGEEVVILLPEQDIDGAVSSGERIRHAVEELGIFHPKSDQRIVTVCTGVSSFTASGQPLGWSDVLEQADQALYRAKEHGRNRACRYTPGLTAGERPVAL